MELTANLRRKPYIKLVIGIVTGIVLSSVIFSGLIIREQQAIIQSFKRDAATQVDMLDRSLRLSQQTVGSMIAFYDATENNTRDEFRLFANRLINDAPALQSLQWVPRVPHSNRHIYEASAKTEFPEFSFNELNNNGHFVDASNRDFYYPIYYIEPYAGNEIILGFDYGSNQHQKAALLKAEQTGMAMVNNRMQLLTDLNQQNSVLLFEPVYLNKAATGISVSDASELEGYIFAVINLKNLIENSLNSLDKLKFTLLLQDLSASGKDRILYFNGSQSDPTLLKNGAESPPLSNELVYSEYLSLADHKWQASITPTSTYYSMAPSFYAWLIYISCLGTTFLVALLLYMSIKNQYILKMSNAALLDLSKEKNKAQQDLLEEKERALVTLNSITDAVITTNELGEIDYANPVAEKMLGISIALDAGKPVTSLLKYIGGQPVETFDKKVQSLSSARPKNHHEECILATNNENSVYVEESFSPIIDPQGNIKGLVLVFSDVTERRKYTREIAYQASHDPLTGLVNRREFEARLKHAVDGAADRSAKHVLCFIDLDQFKSVNDTSGHIAGDALLKELSNLLHTEIRDRDTLARVGGDEFGLLLDNCQIEDGIRISESIISLINKYRFVWQDNVYHVGASIGLVEILPTNSNIDILISYADHACNTAKLSGRNQVKIFNQKDILTSNVGLFLRSDIKHIITENRIQLFCQKIVALDNNSQHINRYEILIRMLDTKGELVLPGAFLPYAERNGQMGSIDRWVISNAFKSIPEAFKDEPQAIISLNISSSTLNDTHFCDELLSLLDNTRIDPKRLGFEIKEAAAIYRSKEILSFLHELKRRGCSIALDNFDGGLSRLSTIKHLPIDLIKIDGHYIQNIVADDIDHAVVKSIQEISAAMGIGTVAECVSSIDIVDTLRKLGIDYAQGFVLSKPKKLDLCL